MNPETVLINALDSYLKGSAYPSLKKAYNYGMALIDKATSLPRLVNKTNLVEIKEIFDNKTLSVKGFNLAYELSKEIIESEESEEMINHHQGIYIIYYPHNKGYKSLVHISNTPPDFTKHYIKELLPSMNTMRKNLELKLNDFLFRAF